MGSGKTSAMINKIKSSSKNTHYMYVVSSSEEVDRIKTICKCRNFVEPKNRKKTRYRDAVTKREAAYNLIREQKNIVITICDFMNFYRYFIGAIQKNQYILILDEVCSNIRELNISVEDISFFNRVMYLRDNEYYSWCGYNPFYGVQRWQRQCAGNRVYKVGDGHYVCSMSPNIIDAFKKTYILTYMFKTQLQSLFGLQHIKYERLYVTTKNGKYAFTKEIMCKKDNIRQLIHIYDKDNLNSVGDEEYALSRQWFADRKNRENVTQLKNNCYNYFSHITEGSFTQKLWTCQSNKKERLKANGYAKSFVPQNIKNTNKYKDCIYLAYLNNKYLHPDLSKYISEKYGGLSLDAYIVSELVQFIWRSAIRDGKEIWIYIPSKRMRELLIDWIDNPEKYENANNKM